METVKVANGKIELNPRLIKWLQPDNELAVLIQGDMLILKKLRLPRLSEIAERAPQDEPMPMEEIATEVHQYRREKRHAGRS
jgi:hypothetical protein